MNLKVLLCGLAWPLFVSEIYAQRLIVRMDDLGGCHSINQAIEKCYKEGIGRSAEIMPVCPWFLEGVRICQTNPGLDVGVHIALTSEWKEYKWRPLTHCPSLCDADGYFYPTNSPNRKIDMKEAETEIRAQIELAMKHIKTVTHISDHMIWSFNKDLHNMAMRIAEEYGLVFQGELSQKTDRDMLNIQSLGFLMVKPGGKRVPAFLEALKKMEKGKTYWTIDHPAFNNDETKALYTKPGENVGADRQDVTDTYTNAEIMDYIKSHDIEIISFKTVIDEYKQRK